MKNKLEKGCSKCEEKRYLTMFEDSLYCPLCLIEELGRSGVYDLVGKEDYVEVIL